MRQKLISKQELTQSSKTLQRASRSLGEEDSSLSSLLFDKSISKEDWKNGLKKHSQKLTNLLLGNHSEGFKEYLSESFGALSPQKNLLDDIAEGIAQLNYKTLLQELLQIAILIEHSTIPPYLTALYSIKDGANPLAAQILRSIAVEEMLHMIMVCNVMNALDIQPSVNKPQNYPSYPTKLPLNVDFYIGLEKFSPNSIETFISIESPTNTTVEAPKYTNNEEQSLQGRGLDESLWTTQGLKDFIQENIHTIGEYYDFVFFLIVVFQIVEIYKTTQELPLSLEALNQGGIFTGGPQKQIKPEQYYGSGGKLFAVETLQGVVEVFSEIKGQGEGTDGAIFYTDPSQFEEGFEPAHYFRFKEIFHEHFYQGGNYQPFTDEHGMMPVITPPVGKEFPIDWNAVYPIKSNLKMADLEAGSPLYEQAKEFNKTYKRLLDAVQAAVEGRQEELEQSILLMYALKEQAVGLMKQPLSDQDNAAPTFEYPVN